jgi:hypothetical protein
MTAIGASAAAGSPIVRRPERGGPVIGPSVVLSAVLAVLHVSLYVLVRGRAGARLPLLLLAAFLGAWAGDAIGGRLGADPLRLGDYSLVAASVVAWLGIGAVAVLAVLASVRGAQPGAPS